MKTKQITRLFRAISRYCMTFLLGLFTLITGCSSDDAGNLFENEHNDDYPVSYVQFHILGPITNGDYEYKDSSGDDEFIRTAYLYTTDEDPDLPEDQIQIYVGKSYSESNVVMTIPRETGLHNIIYSGGANDFAIDILLSSLEENYYVKDISINITELEIDGTSVKHCRGTFSGSFYRDNLVEANVHQINGAFNINQ